MKTRPLHKVLLAVPPTGLFIREDRCQTPIDHMMTIALRPPIDLLYAGAAFEKAGTACKLVDYPGEGLSEEDLKRDLRNFQPDMVLLSITTPGFDEDMRIAQLIKDCSENIIVAAKGAHFNTLDLQSLENYHALDLALRGEYEQTCADLAAGQPWEEIPGITFRDEQDAPHRTADRPFLTDLDALPFPARHLANNALYIRPDTGEMQTTIVTNRGCPFNCSYCLANQVAGRKNRVRSVENILQEIEECVSKYGIRNFLFRSDLFTADRNWLLALCDGILNRGLDISWSCNSRVDTIDFEILAAMRKAGCWIIAYGIESGSQEMLERINKRTDLDTARRALKITRESGVLSSVYFIIGLPWETEETLIANEKFARELDPDIMEIFYVYPFPGTQLHSQVVELGLLEKDEIPKQAYDGPAIDGLHLTRKQMAVARNRAMRRFYMRPRVILRTFSRAKSLGEVLNYFRYGFRQLLEFLSPRSK